MVVDMYVAYAARDQVYFDGREFRSIAYVSAITNILTYNYSTANAIKFKQLDSINACNVREMQMRSETVHGFVPEPTAELNSMLDKQEYREAFNILNYVASKNKIIILPFVQERIKFPGINTYNKKIGIVVIDPVNLRRTFAVITRQSSYITDYYLTDIDGKRIQIMDRTRIVEDSIVNWFRTFPNHRDAIDEARHG